MVLFPFFKNQAATDAIHPAWFLFIAAPGAFHKHLLDLILDAPLMN
jgi:hypothetical protein